MCDDKTDIAAIEVLQLSILTVTLLELSIALNAGISYSGIHAYLRHSNKYLAR
jgi:hypothetical protein